MATAENIKYGISRQQESPVREAELEDARETLQREFAIDSGDGEATEERVEEIMKSPSFLERLRNNPLLRNALKVMVLAFTLMKAEPLVAGEKPGDAAIDGIVKIDEEHWLKENRKLIGTGEYVVPPNVMIAYGETVDPGLIGVPAGGYFKKDYLSLGDREAEFKKRLESLGYRAEEIATYKAAFQKGNIVFNEAELNKSQFRSVLSHERLHLAIANLPAEEKEKLDEARDAVLHDYRNKESQWSAWQDSVFTSVQDGKISQEEYARQSKDAIRKADPVLLDVDGGTEGLMPVLRNSEEFYAYLAMEKFQPAVKDYLITNFPEAFKIYTDIKEGIELQIANQAIGK